MKKNIIIAILALLAISMASCQKNTISDNNDNRDIHFVLNTEQTTKSFIEYDSELKTYSAKWKQGDEIGMVFGTEAKDAKISKKLNNTNPDGTIAKFEGTVEASSAGSFQAVAPAASVEKFYSAETLGFNVGTTSEYKQYPTKTSFDPSCDLLVSKACSYSASEKGEVIINDLEFTRMLAILRVNLTGEYAKGEKVSRIKLTGENSIILSGRVKVQPSNYSIIEWTAKKEYVWAEYTDEEQMPQINTDAVYLIVNPQTISSGSSIELSAETENYTVSKTLNFSKDFKLTAGNVSVINIGITSSDCTPKTKTTYVLQTTSGAFENGGSYIFAYKDGGDGGSYYFINNSGTSNTLTKDKYTVTSGVINPTDDACVFVAATGTASGSFTLKNANNKYIFNGGSNTTLNTNSESETDWLPSFNSGSKTYKLQVNSTDGRYIAVKSTSAVGAYAINGYVDQISQKINVDQYSGAISVFKLDDGKITLSTPTNLAVSGKTVTWDAVSDAGSYKITIGSTEYDSETNSYVYEGADGYYDVSVYALPANPATHKSSAAASLTKAKFGTPKLATPSLSSNGVTQTSVSVKWDLVDNATEGYHCELYKATEKKGEEDVDKSTKNATFTDLEEGVEYVVKVKAKAVSEPYSYLESDVADITLSTTKVQVKDVTKEGTYSINNLVTYAVPTEKMAILGDETGKILLFYNGHGLIVGEKVNVSGNVTKYNGVWEFSSPTITENGSAEVNHGEPVELSTLSSYADNPTITYVHTLGLQSERKITADAYDKKLYLNTTYEDTENYRIETTGYVYGYYSSGDNINYCPTSLEKNGITVSSSAVKLEATAGSTATVTVRSSGAWTANTSTNSQWTVSPTSGSAGAKEVTITASNAGGTSETTLDDLVFTLDSKNIATVSIKQNSSSDKSSKIDFEQTSDKYTEWTFLNLTSYQTDAINAHAGTYYGTTGGKESASVTTKNKIANPKSIKFYISKATNNSTASNWIIQVSSNNNEWTKVKEASAVSMNKGTWVEITQSLTSYTNVYVRILYSGTSAIRTIDDIELTY